jgi:hypothetical protein
MYTLGGVGLVGLGIGLVNFSQPVNSFMRPVIDPINELFGIGEDSGIDTRTTTHDRTYSGSMVSH